MALAGFKSIQFCSSNLVSLVAGGFNSGDGELRPVTPTALQGLDLNIASQ